MEKSMSKHTYRSRSTAFLLSCCLWVLIVGCGRKPVNLVRIQFDSSHEVSGKKFAIRDINPGLPENWDDYHYVVLEMRSTTSQRFQVGFTTESGYNELRVMSYVPNGWIRLAIPLRLYTDLPDPARDLAATYNQPRYTGWINLGGNRGPLRGVDSIGIRMHVPIGDPVIELRSLSLAVEDPGDEYLGDIPVVDEFGQWNLGDFEGKARSLEQLRQEWLSEEGELAEPPVIVYSKYGGYPGTSLRGTGFFRTEKIDGRWWFVDPEGHLFLSLGADCVGPGRGGNANHLDKRPNFYKDLPPGDLDLGPASPNSASIGAWNLYRRFGEEFPEKSRDMIIRRMEKWGLNTIANWSDREVISLNRKAFMLPLYGLGMDAGIMGLADVYHPDFVKNTEAVCQRFVEAFVDNPWLIGYFVANEPSWLGQEPRLCDLILDGGADKPIAMALAKYLDQGDTPARRREFIHRTFSIFLETVQNSLKKYDPDHLNLGIRFGHIPDDEMLDICKNVFDVFSFNCYDLSPSQADMDRVMRVTDLPMIIGEYHFGTVDRGMAQALVQVENQKERGVAYRHYTENAFAHPGLIGVAYFQWPDQDLTGRSYDGENYNCGLVDVTDRPYEHMVGAIMETARHIFDIHAGRLQPFDQLPLNPCGYGAIPDVWEE
jgi:hypothetical protein